MNFIFLICASLWFLGPPYSDLHFYEQSLLIPLAIYYLLFELGGSTGLVRSFLSFFFFKLGVVSLIFHCTLFCLCEFIGNNYLPWVKICF